MVLFQIPDTFPLYWPLPILQFRKRIKTTKGAASHLKNVDQGSGQGAGRRKSAAYTVVCEHFEPTRNAAMGTQTHF
jgi:hypothetical protein